MKNHFYILIFILSTLGCKDNLTKKNNINDKLDSNLNVKNKYFIFSEYDSDSVKIDLRQEDTNFVVLVTANGLHKEYDLGKLDIPVKTPELIWINKEYACIVTWWSQAQSRHIFIPLNERNKFLYFDKGIQKMDSLNNNIVYIDTDTINPDHATFKVTNLLSQTEKSLTIRVDRYNGNYPFYDKIILNKNDFTIITAYEKKTIDIEFINNGL